MSQSSIIAIHNKIVRRFSEEKTDGDISVDEMKRELDELHEELDKINSTDGLTKADLTRINLIEDLIDQKERQIHSANRSSEGLVNSNDSDYYAQNGHLLFKYFKTIDNVGNKKVTVTAKTLFQRNKAVNIPSPGSCAIQHKYLSNTNPDYVFSERSEVNHDNYCSECKKFRVINPVDAEMICEGCGSQTAILIDSEKNQPSEPHMENKHCDYDHKGHFKDELDKLQGKESTTVPHAVIVTVRTELDRDRIDHSCATEDLVRSYLKKHKNKKYDKYFGNIQQILYKVTKKPPLIIPSDHEKMLIHMFQSIRASHDRHCPPTRKNFSSYSFLIFKFCELKEMDYPEGSEQANLYRRIREKVKLLKSKDKLHQLDKIWKNICGDMGWKYMPSI